MVYVISVQYSTRTGQDEKRARLLAALQRAGDTIRVQDDVYFVDTPVSAAECRDLVAFQVDEADSVIVANITDEWASFSARPQAVEWLNSHRLSTRRITRLF